VRSRHYVTTLLLVVGIGGWLLLGPIAEAWSVTYSNPYSSSAFNQDMWNIATGSGNVDGTGLTIDGLSIPTWEGGAVADAELVGAGLCLECLGVAFGVGATSYLGVKVVEGIANRFFSFGGSTGTAYTNSLVDGEDLCGVFQGGYTTASGSTTVPACDTLSGSGTLATSGSALAMPPGTTTDNYFTVVFHFPVSNVCAMGSGSGGAYSAAGGLRGMALVLDPSHLTGTNTTNFVNCTTAVWNAYQSYVADHSELAGLTVTIPQATCQSDLLSLENGGTGIGYNTSCSAVYIPHSVAAAALEHQAAQPFTNQTATSTQTLSPALTTTPNTTNLARMRAVIGAQTTGSPAWFNCTLDSAEYTCPTGPGDAGGTKTGTGTVGSTFLLPQPSLSETYDHYIQRLRDAGYVGAVTVTDDSMPFPDGTPGAYSEPGTITEVGSDQTGTGTITYATVFNRTTGQLGWPTSAPSVTPGVTSTIDIKKVPASWNPSVHSPPPSGPIGPGTTNGGCTCPPLNFSPLTGLSYGTKFPFGIFTWLATAFGTITGGGTTAPGFDVGKPAALGGGTYHVDLSNADWEATYRPVVFGVLEFGITLGAVWFVGWRILGIGGGPGDDDD
jgi:hypothetical protein